GGGPLAFIHKTRDITRPNQAVANRVVGEVEGRDCVLVDDLIDTGGTIAEAVKVLREAGARDVIVAATHGVLSDPAAQRLSECGAREVVITDTLPIPADKQFAQLRVLARGRLLARAIRDGFGGGSVTSLFDGASCPHRGDPGGPDRRRPGPHPAVGIRGRAPVRGCSRGARRSRVSSTGCL